MGNRTDKWRVPPRRVGKVEPAARLDGVGRAQGDLDALEIIERNVAAIVVGIAAAVLTLAAYVWATDWFVGHIHG